MNMTIKQLEKVPYFTDHLRDRTHLELKAGSMHALINIYGFTEKVAEKAL